MPPDAVNPTPAPATNVLSQRFGSGTIDGLGRELGRFIVTTMELPWNLVRHRLGAAPVAVLDTQSMELDWLERQAAQAPPCDAVLAVGGGQAVDFGKFLAWKLGKRLVTVPTVVSVDAFVTPTAAVRRQHRVEYLGHASPDPLVIDYDLLRSAPPQLNIAGVGDILSIHTATFDWETAHRAGRDVHRFAPEQVAQARSIVETVAAEVDEIRANTDRGLQTLVDCYLRINSVCLPAGHYRSEEGSEHFLFYELEERLGRNFIHGHIVGLGVYLMSRLQQNRHDQIVDLMRRLDLHFQPRHLDLSRQVLSDSLANLAEYCRRRNHWYSAVHEREISAGFLHDALAELEF